MRRDRIEQPSDRPGDPDRHRRILDPGDRPGDPERGTWPKAR
jgi:hypothetical protein